MAPDEPDLVPAVITQDDDPDDDDGCPTPSGRMEIVIERGSRVIVGADVDTTSVARVLEVLDRR